MKLLIEDLFGVRLYWWQRLFLLPDDRRLRKTIEKFNDVGMIYPVGKEELQEMKKYNLEWNVYYHDSNVGNIKAFNVFDHGGFYRDVEQLMKDKSISRDKFSEAVRHSMMYYFWSKSEYEVVIKEWCGKPFEIKVDIFHQVQMNWDHFIDYLWRVKNGT